MKQMHYGKKSAGAAGRKGAGLGWGVTGPGGTSKSKPVKKGPYTPGNKGSK